MSRCTVTSCENTTNVTFYLTSNVMIYVQRVFCLFLLISIAMIENYLCMFVGTQTWDLVDDVFIIELTFCISRNLFLVPNLGLGHQFLNFDSMWNQIHDYHITTMEHCNSYVFSICGLLTHIFKLFYSLFSTCELITHIHTFKL